MNIMPGIEGTRAFDDTMIALTFGRTGSITTLPNGGIDLEDGDAASWTEQQTAWFEIVPRWPAHDVTLKLSARPFLVENRIDHQQVFIYVNGLFCGLQRFDGPLDCPFHIPRNAISGRIARITLAIPSAISPKQLGLSEDVRALGIAITAISLVSR